MKLLKLQSSMKMKSRFMMIAMTLTISCPIGRKDLRPWIFGTSPGILFSEFSGLNQVNKNPFIGILPPVLPSYSYWEEKGEKEEVGKVKSGGPGGSNFGSLKSSGPGGPDVGGLRDHHSNLSSCGAVRIHLRVHSSPGAIRVNCRAHFSLGVHRVHHSRAHSDPGEIRLHSRAHSSPGALLSFLEFMSPQSPLKSSLQAGGSQSPFQSLFQSTSSLPSLHQTMSALRSTLKSELIVCPV